MSVQVMFLIIALILFVIFESNHIIDTKKFIKDTEPYFHVLMEDDYEFLLNVRYNGDYDLEKAFSDRVRTAMVALVVVFIYFLNKINGINFFVYMLLAIIVAFLAFKLPYTKLKKYYKANLHHINLMLPYYLKSLEILIQHYTVPVALGKSIETAPEIFRPGLKRLISKIDAGDFSVDPYMDFAKEYQVRDSMRMMRLLYRLGLGSQENKQEQLMMFSRTVSSLQNKSREQKYQNRLEKMENKTMMMLGATGGGILMFMLLSMMMMMQF